MTQQDEAREREWVRRAQGGAGAAHALLAQIAGNASPGLPAAPGRCPPVPGQGHYYLLPAPSPAQEGRRRVVALSLSKGRRQARCAIHWPAY